MLAKEGLQESEIAQVMAHLRDMSARLVISENGDPSPASDDAPASRESTPDHGTDCSGEVSMGEKPVVSRLGDDPRFQDIILTFIDKLESTVCEMEDVYQEGDLDQLAFLAHWLKGAGGTVGFDDFTEPAAKLEEFSKARQKENSGQMLARVKGLTEAIEPPGGGTRHQTERHESLAQSG